jgi:hypothetical protein
VRRTRVTDLTGFDCAHPDQWKQTPTGLADFHDKVTPQHPLYIPESTFLGPHGKHRAEPLTVQAGSFDGWGPGSPGYSKCNVRIWTSIIRQ